jgi:hypothetical protein
VSKQSVQTEFPNRVSKQSFRANNSFHYGLLKVHGSKEQSFYRGTWFEKVHGSKRYIKRYKEGSEEQVPVPKVGPEARPVLHIKHSGRIKFRVPRNHFSHNCQVAQSKACVVLPGVLLPTDTETEDQKQKQKQKQKQRASHLCTYVRIHTPTHIHPPRTFHTESQTSLASACHMSAAQRTIHDAV